MKNISYIYSLLESCKLNNLSFGDDFENICIRIMRDDKDYSSIHPYGYKATKANAPAEAME